MDGEKAWERTGYGKEGELAEVQLNGFRKCSCKDSDQEGVLLLDRRGNQRIHEKFMWYLLFTGTPNSNANNTLKGFLFLITCPSVHMCFHMSIGTQRGQKMTLDPLEVELQGLWICPLWVLRTEFVSFQEQEMFLVTGLAPCPANPVCHWGCFYTLHRVTTEEMIQ